MRKSEGFIQIAIILIVLALIGGAYYFGNKNKQNVASEVPTSNPVSSSSKSGLEHFKNDDLGIEFDYPSYKTIYISKLGMYNFLTKIMQDGTTIDLANNGGGQIDIYNNPNNVSLVEALKLQDKSSKAPIFAPGKTIQIAGTSAVVKYENWDAGVKTVVFYFVHKSEYFVASRGVASFNPDETVQMAENELLGILKTFKFTK